MTFLVVHWSRASSGGLPEFSLVSGQLGWPARVANETKCHFGFWAAVANQANGQTQIVFTAATVEASCVAHGKVFCHQDTSQRAPGRHARLAKGRREGVVERPQENHTATAALGGNDGSLVHHPCGTAKELSIEEALALADAADQTLERLDRYRAGNGGIGPGKGKYGRRGTLQVPSLVRVMQNVLVPDTTEIRRKGMIARGKAANVPP